jgi:hypothetical protein
MKKILIIILTFTTSTLFSQNISLEEVITLRTKNLAVVEEYLTAKGWDLINTEVEGESSLGSMDFAYNKSNYNDKAEAFVTYLYSEKIGRKRISIQMSKKEKYTLFLNQVKSKGVSLIKSKIEDDLIKKVYQNKSLTFIVTTSTQVDDFSSTKTTYSFLVITNSDFEINFND